MASVLRFAWHSLLPTLADILSLPTRPGLAIGNCAGDRVGDLRMPLTYSGAKGHVESRVKVALAAFIGLHIKEALQSLESWNVLEHYSSQARKMVKERRRFRHRRRAFAIRRPLGAPPFFQGGRFAQ